MFEVFNKTVRGKSHIDKNIPCQDYSSCFEAKDGSWYCAIVADGHGDPTCTRSDRGSKIAVGVAHAALCELAEHALRKDGFSHVVTDCLLLDYDSAAREKGCIVRTMADDLSDGTTGGETMRILASTIVGKWYDEVMEDIDKHPLTDEELTLMGASKEVADRKDSSLRHAYGTTLICCMICNNKALLLQQGDGRCEVIFANGVVSQPIPWDDRCYDLYTTSLCDHNAPQKTRTWVLDLQQSPVAAIFMGSDGIEDSFPEMEGTHCFYRKLSGSVVEFGNTDALESFLEDYLSSMSASGSADDMSVAGIVDTSRLRSLLPTFDRAIAAYESELEARKLDQAIQSKARKYDALKEQGEDKRREFEDFVNEYNELVERRNALRKQIPSNGERKTLPQHCRTIAP